MNFSERGARAGATAALLFAFGLTGCGQSADRAGNASEQVPATPLPTATPAPTPEPPSFPPQQTAQCASPLPREVQQHIVTSNVPNALDSARVNPVFPTTDFHVSVFLPERCPGDTFPVVMESHGYSGAREQTLDDDGVASPDDPHFPSLDVLFTGLPFHGYVAVSFDERGHGDSTPDNASNPGGYARGIDPEAETQDAIALLDFLYDNRAAFFIHDQSPATGIAKDFHIGLIGGSYGGAYQMALAALDQRIDTIVPNGTWHNLLYALLPGDAVKLGFAGLLCLLADQGGVVNSPVFAETCNAVSYDNPGARNQRTRADLAADVATRPGSISEAEVVELFGTHGMNFLQKQEAAGQPALSTGSEAFGLRSIPSLFLQGNRDVLFNMTEAYWNWNYFRSAADAGVPVKVLTTEGAHMNPLANQVEAGANCGPFQGVVFIRAWYDFHLRGMDSSEYQNIPDVCVSVADTASAHTATPVAVTLNDMLIGSQSGAGAVPARLEIGAANVTDIPGTETFLPVVTISGNNKVLAGIPRLDQIVVTDGDDGGVLPEDVTAIAYVGVGIQRGGSTFLVDDQLTAFLEGTHVDNRNIGNGEILLAGIGEQLQNGDVVGLLFFENHVQYSAVIDFSTAGGGTGLVGLLTGVELPPLLDPLSPLFAQFQAANPYTATVTGVELPIIDVTQFPGAALVQ